MANLEAFRDAKWLTEEGALESAKDLEEKIGLALKTPEGLKYWFGESEGKYARRGLYDLWNSQLGVSVAEGLATITNTTCNEKGNAKKAEEARLILENYPTKTVVTAAVMVGERVPVIGILDPMGAAMLGASLEMAFAEAKDGARNAGEVVLNLATSLGASLKEMRTTQGRIKHFVEPVTELIKQPCLVEEALGYIERGEGAWGHPQPSDHTKAVALGLRKLWENS